MVSLGCTSSAFYKGPIYWDCVPIPRCSECWLLTGYRCLPSQRRALLTGLLSSSKHMLPLNNNNHLGAANDFLKPESKTDSLLGSRKNNS